MSGHSKWATIKHKKGALDAKRGKVFTKLIREITIAARIGGGDPDSNPRLRTVFDKAKAANMPADNIKRAIKKGTGELEGTTYEDLVLEGYGPGGVAILVEGTTDNRNRTRLRDPPHLHEARRQPGRRRLRRLHVQAQGRDRDRRGEDDEDKLMEIALDAGADDIVTEAAGFTVYTTPHAFEAVRDAIKKAGIEPDEAEVKKLADNNITLEGTKAQQLLKLIEALDDHDDVSTVWDNSDISDAEMEAAAAS